MPSLGDITASLARIMGKIGSVGKNGTNEGADAWKYATIEDVLSKVQPLLAEEGLVIFQSEIDRELLLDDTVLAIKYRFVVAHKNGYTLGGGTYETEVCHTGMCRIIDDRGNIDDKAANKCHTAARKYFLLALFQIPAKNIADPDRDAVQRTRVVSKPKQESTSLAEGAKAIPNIAEWISPTKLGPVIAGEEVKWAQKCAAHIRSARTAAEAESWYLENKQSFDDLAQNASAIHDRLIVVLDDHKDQFKVAKADNAARAAA